MRLCPVMLHSPSMPPCVLCQGVVFGWVIPVCEGLLAVQDEGQFTPLGAAIKEAQGPESHAQAQQVLAARPQNGGAFHMCTSSACFLAHAA